MIFEKEFLSLIILDVVKIEQRNVKVKVKGRNFDALSFRMHFDARLEANGKRIDVSKGSVAYVPAKLDYLREADVDELIAIHFQTSEYVSRGIEVLTPRDIERFSGLFHKILAIWESKVEGYRYLANACLYEIFSECQRECAGCMVDNSKIRASVEYMLGHYRDSDLTIGDIAARSFMSEVYFRKIFKEEYGISPQKYIVRLRLQYAIKLMSTGEYSLKDVALSSGYSDYKYFSSEFKKNYGVSPSKYGYDIWK